MRETIKGVPDKFSHTAGFENMIQGVIKASTKRVGAAALVLT